MHFLVRTLLITCPPTDFLVSIHIPERLPSYFFLARVSIPFWGLCPQTSSKPNYLPLPNTLTLGIRASAYTFEGQTSGPKQFPKHFLDGCL